MTDTTKKPSHSEIKRMHAKWITNFLKERDMTIAQMCIGLNKWRMKRGLEPVEGTPFKVGNKTLEWKRSKWSGHIDIRAKEAIA